MAAHPFSIRLAACAGFLFFVPPNSLFASAAADLGEGLRYLRINNTDTDAAALRSALSQPAPLVIDLRRVASRDGAAALLDGVASGGGLPASVLSVGTDAPPLRLLLVNTDTPAGLLRAFALPAPGWLTLGPASPWLTVDIAVSASVEADRRAVAALVAGVPPEKLLNRQPEKNRYDEAALIRDYTNQPAEAPAPASHDGNNDNGNDSDNSNEGNGENNGTESAPPDVSAAQPATPAVELPLADAVLQRARDIHRALLILKKIP